VSREATILHADADAFFASVEQRDDPSLRGRPVCVGQGVVMAASYEARAFGIRGGMGGGRAKQLCPDAIFVPPRFSAYTDASRALFAAFGETAPAVEGLSLGRRSWTCAASSGSPGLPRPSLGACERASVPT
jgi:DNA polymerase-4